MPKTPIELEETEEQIAVYWHPQKEKLKLAFWILGALFLLYLFSIISYSVGCNAAGEKIFDAAQKILPPIATLIIGYYFARKNK